MSEVPAYERDPYLRSLETEVLGSDLEDGRHFVVLADTLFYPEGGGQPADRGSIDGTPVTDVRSADGTIRHFLRTALPRGPVHLTLDWDRRFDHMQQHTAQHLLTAVALECFGWSTTAFHLGDEVSDIELQTAGIAPEQRRTLEEAVAAEIRAARDVTARRVTADEYARLAVRSRGLPDGHRGPIRLVEILGLDLNTCGGTHVRSTAEIEALALLAAEPMRGGTRLWFAAGRRVRHRLAAHETRTAELRKLLGAADGELGSAVRTKLEQLKDAQRQLRTLDEALAAEAARTLAASPCHLVDAHWPERDAAFLQYTARAFVALAPDRVSLLTAGRAEEGFFLLCAGEQVRVDLSTLGREVASVLGGRGGGSSRIFQGKASKLSRRADALNILRARLEPGASSPSPSTS